MGRPLWFVKLVQLLYKRRKLAAIMTNIPILGYFIDQIAFKGDKLVILPKDHVIRLDQSINLQGSLVLPSKVAEAFVEQSNYRWLMNFCMCRTANKCKDYPADVGCLFLGEAAMHINPKLGRPVSKIEAIAHLKKGRELGLIHLVGKVKGDALWLGAKPEKKLLTICNCCPCCCISGLIKYLAPQIAANYTKMPGVEVRVTDRCVGCGTCAKICFVNAIRVINDRATIGNMCRGCGRCVEVCPRKAIELTLTDVQFLQKSIGRIAKLVDLT